MDVLTDVLQVTNMANTLLCQTEFSAPWGVAIDASNEIVVHVVQQDGCWLSLGDEHGPLRVSDGDIILLTGGQAHSISDALGRPMKSPAEMMAELGRRPVDPASEKTLMLCAKYRFDGPGPNPFIEKIPAFIHLKASETVGNAQLQHLLQMLRLEAGMRSDGTELVVPRLVDALLVLILRAWLASYPEMSAGWFRAFSDPAIMKALGVIHSDPAKDWTVELLAEKAGKSRSTFARQFSELVGEPPLSYVTRWRMVVSAKLLQEGSLRVEQVAQQVGYEGAPSFSKAFKRHFGFAPSEMRSVLAE